MLTLNICEVQRQKAMLKIEDDIKEMYITTSNFDRLDDVMGSFIQNVAPGYGLKETHIKHIRQVRNELVNQKRYLGFYEKLKYENLNHAPEVLYFFKEIETIRCTYADEKKDEFREHMTSVTTEVKRALDDDKIEGFEYCLLRDIIRAAYKDAE